MTLKSAGPGSAAPCLSAWLKILIVGKRFRGLLVLAWVAVVVTLAAVVIMYVLGGPGPEMPDRAQISGALLAAIVMVPPGVWWAWTHRHATVSRTSTSTQVEAAVELLATRTFDYWSREMTRRGIQNPAPVPVRWSWAADDIALRWQDFVASSSLSTDPVPLPGSRFGHGNADQVLDSGLVTQLHEEVYSRLSHGWLVLIGPPGSGKTGAMILLLLEALKHRKQVRRRDRAAVPVPVWLHTRLLGSDLEGLTRLGNRDDGPRP